MSCPVCSNTLVTYFNAKVLGKYNANYEYCETCGFLRAENPHWLDEAYTRAIANTDTGLVMRNITLANKVTRLLYWLNNERGDGRYLDAAGGYGIFTRLMRDFGMNFFWYDKYCENLVAPGFEYNKEFGNCLAVTAIEVLEHLVDPKQFLTEILMVSGAKTIIFTTELYEGTPPKPEDWHYYSFSTGQHIGFFQLRTLRKLADDMNMLFYTANSLHIFTYNPINSLLLNLVTNRYLSIFVPFLIRKKLGSKTLADNNLMMDILRKNQGE